MSDPHTPAGPATQGQEPPAPESHSPLAPYNTLPAYGSAHSSAAPSAAQRLVVGLVGAVLGGLLFVTAGLMSAAAANRFARFDFSVTATLPLVGFAALSIAIVAALLLMARSTAVGLYVAGALQFLIGVLYFAFPMAMYSVAVTLGDATRGLDFYFVSGCPSLVGTALVAAGFAMGRIRRRTPVPSSVPAAFR